MLRKFAGWKCGAGALALAFAAMGAAVPAQASVKDGVDAWTRGDYAAAVNAWQGPAQAGDADAMFNLAQAYRLGRGVPVDAARAEALYASAAAAGHVPAAETYGLMLFQDGRREAALPFVEDAARRGDPRSQYLLGIAYFNGDLLPRDWIRAYALLTLANSAGLPQAASALAEMDQTVPLDQRQQAAGMAVELQAAAQAERARQLAAADLGSAPGGSASMASAAQSTPRVPGPIQTTAVSPSVAAARDAVAQASQATGTSSPAVAGASFAGGGQTAAAAAPVSAAARPAAPPASAGQASGPWRVQLGAFSVAGNAERLWSRLSSRPELAGRQRMLVPTGNVTRLLAGGYPTQASAATACNALKAAGQDCLVTRN